MNEETRERAVPTMRVDVGFNVTGGELPVDHGYALFSAICRQLGDLHGAEWLAIHPLAGTALAGDALAVRRPPGPAQLTLRVTPDKIPVVMPLAGKTLDVGGHPLQLGTSRLYVLAPLPALASRIVTIKGYLEPEPFAKRLSEELGKLGVSTPPEVGRRRVVTVAGDKVVGFAVRLSGLSDEQSLTIQYEGLGGRRRFGCGVFGPATRPGRR